MSEIPEDVMKMARHYANETSPPGQQPIEQHNHRKLAFARAIMAERERCADLSDALAAGFERLAAGSMRKRKWNETLALNFRAHADAIRSGGRP